MTTTPVEKAFLTALVRGLEQADCHPILLRNHEGFPDEIGNDLDIFVPEASLDNAFAVLRDCAADEGGEIGHVHRRGYFVAVWLRFPGSGRPVHIDLYHGALTWHGQRFLRDNELMTASRMTGGGIPYRIPAAGHEALVSLLASILWGGFFKARYRDHLRALVSSPVEMERFTRQLEDHFGHEGMLLAEAVARKDASSLVTRAFSGTLRRKLMMRNLLTGPARSVRSWLEHWLEEAACYLARRPGAMVEYPMEAFTADQLDGVRDRLSPYFGGTRDLVKTTPLLKRLAVVWRLRGKNHLVLLESDRFAINGSGWPDQGTGPDGLVARTLETLSRRIPLQYH